MQKQHHPGFAVGYESTVAMILVIAAAIFLSVLTYSGTPPLISHMASL